MLNVSVCKISVLFVVNEESLILLRDLLKLELAVFTKGDYIYQFILLRLKLF